MRTILVVEDSRTFAQLLSRRLKSELEVDTVWTRDLAETADVLAERDDFLCALLDLNLPDAPTGQVVDLVTSRNIPSIVFTGELDDDLRDQIWARNIVDYVMKDNVENVAYILNLVRRIEANADTRVLVVDDSSMMRNHLENLLQTHRYRVHTAAGGAQALEILAEYPDIALVITDYNMPDMNGYELTRAIRRTHPKDRTAILGISGHGGQTISAHFIKAGANDFLNKPFITEELYCRVAQNIEMIELVRTVREMSERDFLTRVHNRKYLFETGQNILAQKHNAGEPVALAMIDLDRFKTVNDTWGHAMGDLVLRRIAQAMCERFREGDIIVRYGGEEFCVMALDMDPADAPRIFDEFRRHLASLEFDTGETVFSVTASIGLCTTTAPSLDTMLYKADEALYEAKRAGRDRTVVAD